MELINAQTHGNSYFTLPHICTIHYGMCFLKCWGTIKNQC